jgi:hypothetical protein
MNGEVKLAARVDYIASDSSFILCRVDFDIIPRR